jgi:hypothetical protein
LCGVKGRPDGGYTFIRGLSLARTDGPEKIICQGVFVLLFVGCHRSEHTLICGSAEAFRANISKMQDLICIFGHFLHFSGKRLCVSARTKMRNVAFDFSWFVMSGLGF